MIEHPILFSAEMVRAILEGRKTQTRRVIKQQPSGRENFPPNKFSHPDDWYFRDGYYACPENDIGSYVRCPYGKVGDKLWVRESFRVIRDDKGFGLVYVADNTTARYWPNYDKGNVNDIDAFALKHANGRGLPSIHMPRWASRITLEITEVRVQRVQEITEAEEDAEGIMWLEEMRLIEEYGHRPAGIVDGCMKRHAFMRLWEELNGKKAGCAWADNPWVWCVSFQRVEEAVH